MYRVVESAPEIAAQLEHVQRLCFPALAEIELILADHYAAQIQRFAEGQFTVVTDDGKIVACSTDFRTRIDYDHFQHRYIDAVDDNWLGNHIPDGDWMYDADIAVVPAHRGRGVTKLLFFCRQERIRELVLRGHVPDGLLAGCGQHIGRTTSEEYEDQFVAENIFDPRLVSNLDGDSGSTGSSIIMSMTPILTTRPRLSLEKIRTGTQTGLNQRSKRHYFGTLPGIFLLTRRPIARFAL